MDLTMAQEDAVANAPVCIAPVTISPHVSVESGEAVALDEQAAEDLYLSASEEGRGVGWVLFHCFRPEVVPQFRLAALAGQAVAFPVRLLTSAIIPAYVAAATPEAVINTLPLGIEPLVIPFLRIAGAAATYSCWI